MSCPTFERQLRKYDLGQTQSTRFSALCKDHRKIEVKTLKELRRMKDYVSLNAYELGMIMAAVDKVKLTDGLLLKLRVAVAKVYLDSGFTKEQVFGDYYQSDEVYKAYLEDVKDE